MDAGVHERGAIFLSDPHERLDLSLKRVKVHVVRAIFGVLATSILLLTGCGDNSSKSTSTATNASSSGSPLSAPGDYISALGKGQKDAVKTIDTTSINKAVELFNVDQGRNPKDLNELVEKKYLPQIPAAPLGSKLVYDASSGKVSVVKQ